MKVYALTKERDTLRREQSRKSDAAALLKEKDEIINQVMAEGKDVRNPYSLAMHYGCNVLIIVYSTFVW